jgi:hypothetical protein
VHSAGAPSAGGHGESGYGEDGYEERAETYVRLLAEAALRPPADGDTSRVRSAAEVLIDAGVLSDQTAAEIITELQTALRVRGKREVVAARSRLVGLRGFKPGSPSGQPGGPQEPWRVVPLGPPPAGSRLMALIRTTGRALAPAVLYFSPAPIALLDEFPLTTLTATDDVGTDYRLGFPDGTWAGSTWTGMISLHPAPPLAARRLEIFSPNGPVLRADLTATPAGHAPPVTLLGPAPQSPGERLLTRRAEGMLAALPQASSGGPGPHLPDTEELTTTLEAAGLLSPLSAAPARVAALGQLLGLAAEGPASEVPARWMAVAAYYGRRRRPAPVTGTAAIGVVLPELDGARFAVAGLHCAGPASVLHVVGEGMRLRGRRGLPGRRPGEPGVVWDPAYVDGGFSWWVRDDAGGWHLGAIEEVNPMGGREGLLRMALLPPLGHPTSSLALEVSGPAQQVTATLPVRW